MANLPGKSAWIATGVVLLLALAVVPTVAGASSHDLAAGVTAASASGPCSGARTSTGAPLPDTQWAYGGQGWSNWTFTFRNVSISYNSSFGWTVVFTAVSNATTGITMLEEQRTLGITVWSNVTKPNLTVAYFYHAVEVDGAFANVTNESTVYVDDQPVPALGILNASVAACSAIDQSLQVANETTTRMASLNVTGVAEASVGFSPSLGLVPLNLTGVKMWNSSSTATSAASWNISYSYTKLNGASGSGSQAGSLSGTAQVNLTGYRCSAQHPFTDHKSRQGVVLVLRGPFTSYDGFILLPRAFDFFGTASHGYGSFGFGSAGISAESLYLSPHAGGFAVTAADQSFAAFDTGAIGFAAPRSGGFAPEASSSPTATVYGQPMTVRQAKSLDQGLTALPSTSARTSLHGVSSMTSGSGFWVAFVVVVVAGTVGAAATVAWVTSVRRHSPGVGMEVPAGPKSFEDPNRPS